MQALTRICSLVTPPTRKERFEIILEPFQAVTQLAMLSFCPQGSKLSIVDNILYVQPPSWRQPLERSYYADRRDDLFYLFKMITRFNRFYGYFKDEQGTLPKLFVLLTELSKTGIDVLIQTYSDGGNETLLHTLQMYRTMLDKPDLLAESEAGLGGPGAVEEGGRDIDNVFIQITELYSAEHFSAVYNILLLAQRDPADHAAYVAALHHLLGPLHVRIKKWIRERIVF